MVKFGGLNDMSEGSSVDIEYLKIDGGKPVELVILSHINPETVGKDKFKMGEDLLVYRAWKPYRDGFKFMNAEGNAQYFSLPVISEDEFDTENSVNPYVDIFQLLRVKEEVKLNYFLWVMDAETKQIKLYNPPVTVVYELSKKEELTISKKKKPLKGSIVTISKEGKGKNTKYSVTPMFETVDVSGVEFPCDLRELPAITMNDSIDKQIRYLNTIKKSVMSYCGMATESEWPFTEDDTVKPEFLATAE